MSRFTDHIAMPANPLPLPINAAPDPLDRAMEPLLSEPFASALDADEAAAMAASGPLRSRLLTRLQASRAASAAMITSRPKRLATAQLAAGVAERVLYAAAQDRPLRPGEPWRARLLELQPGSRWQGPDASCHREWLVLRGSAGIGREQLHPRDYHAAPAGAAVGALSSERGALLFLRESAIAPRPADAPFTVRDADAGWPEFAPGIRRRVLWQRDGQAALLYHAQRGAAVPQHTHGHDEECLMVQGELFLDDLLLQEGDYQLAPAGTGHHITETDTGVVIYAHGDLDLRFVA
ncbi:MAG: cupin domain-containing protein [Proteobacteria bacterium]|nr:cupin domain-containing protein [Pseudomonadota bacterium]MBS0494111.1 cupin domain-containing protein [Pseudomonadota bacterium]